jgi:hypothetical protein
LAAGGSPRSRFYYARIAVLSAVLVVVVAYAVHDVRSRRARKAWDHTLAVAVIIIRNGAVDDDSIAALRDRAPALAARLESELHRYAPGAPAPFVFTVFGAAHVQPAPALSGDGLIALASHAWDLHRWTSDVDARANVAAGAYDSRIYVTVQPPTSKKHMIEGSSEQGGRVGVVTVDLDALTVDYALSVVAHELFHTLDATDEYDDVGRAKIPDGLAEPDLVPRFPQRLVEVMTRGRPTSPTDEKTLDTIDELGVGPTTAREIGWTR